MKYSISINQLALSKVSPTTTLKEAVILDYLVCICSAKSKRIYSKRIQVGGEYYTWVNYKHLIEEMPLLKFKTNGAVALAIGKLEEAGFLKTHLVNGSKKYVAITEKADSLIFYNTEEENVNRLETSTLPLRNVNGEPLRILNQLNIINNNKENKDEDSSSSTPIISEQKHSAIDLSATGGFRDEKKKKKTEQSKSKLTDSEKVIAKQYRKFIFPSANDNYKSLQGWLPTLIRRTFKVFKEQFADEAQAKMLEAIEKYSKKDNYVSNHRENMSWFRPERFFSREFANSDLIPLVTNPPTNGNLCNRPQTDEELREIKEGNKRRAEERRIRIAKRKADNNRV